MYLWVYKMTSWLGYLFIFNEILGWVMYASHSTFTLNWEKLLKTDNFMYVGIFL